MTNNFLRTGIGILAVVAGVCATASDAAAATYFVDQNSSATSDNNPGTRERPWRSLAKACRTVQPGDTVVVRAGRYNERLNFYSGNLRNSTRTTTFRAEPNVWIYGADTANAPNLVIRGFNVTMPESFISSDWTARYAFFVRSDNVQIFRNYVYNFPGVGVQGYWVDPWPKNVQVRANTFRRVNQGVVVQGTNWLVQGNEVDRLVRWTLDCDYMRFFGDNILIRNNFLHGARLSEIGISHVDGFQTFPNNGWHAENVTISSNYVESFHQGAMIGVPQHAQMSGYLRGIRFYNNVFVGGEIGGSWGVQTMDAQKVQIQHNLFVNMKASGAAVGLREYSTGHVRNNIFYNGGQNYYSDSTSRLYGGYNVLNRQPTYPLYRNSRDATRDPQLVNPWNLLGPDGRPRTADDGYRLKSTSPARDAGFAIRMASDMYGRRRPVGTRSDIGPHEYSATAAKSVTTSVSSASEAESLSGTEAIEILLENSTPIDTSTIWADLPTSIQRLVRVEWVADETEANGVWVRVVPTTTWDVIAKSGGLVGTPFTVTVGSETVTSGTHLYVVN